MLRSRTIAFQGFHERDGRERPHVDKNPAYAVNPESERAENRDVLSWDPVNSRFARLKCNRARTAFEEENKANKTYRQFYRQLALPAVTISNLQRREAPLSTCNHC
jgi:hypothetical protein